MGMLARLSFLATGTLLAVVCKMPSAVAASFFSITPLPFIPADLNDRAQVVGNRFLWEQGNLTDLSTLPSASGSLDARAISPTGLIVGGGLIPAPTPENPAPFPQAFQSDGKTVTPLNLPSDSRTATNAVGVNSVGQIAAVTTDLSFSPVITAAVQQPDGTVRFILGNARATAINEAGVVTTDYVTSGRVGPGTGVVWDNGNYTALSSSGYCNPFGVPTCPVIDYNPATIVTTDINDRNEVVGSGPIERGGSVRQALLWVSPQLTGSSPDPNEALQLVRRFPEQGAQGIPLGTLGGNSAAIGINNASQIVGFAETVNGDRRAVIWLNGTPYELTGLIDPNTGWQLVSAVEINNNGQIIGTGVLNGQTQGFLLDPTRPIEEIPEPETAIGAFAGLGLLGLAIRVKRFVKRRKSKRS